MKILVLVHEFPPVGGGGGRVAEDICRELSKRGHEIKVLTSHMRGLAYGEERYGFQIMRLRSFRTQPYRADFLTMLAYIWVGIWAGLGLIARWRPDIIHVHFAVPAGALAWVLYKLTGVPYIVTAHLGDVPGGVSEKTTEWFRYIFPFTPPIWKDAGRVTAVSNYTRELAERYYHVEIVVIKNGIDLSLIDGTLPRVHAPPKIAFAGRFVDQKNPLQVVKTLSGLKHLEWECVMLGDGPLFEDVEKLIALHKMKHRFILTGWVSPQEVLTWFEKSDILFLPSLSEGLPVVGIKALVKGMAIVASRVGGFVDLVEEGKNGHLISPYDEEAMMKVLQEFLTDKAKLQRARSRSLDLARQFDIISIVDSYEKIMTGLVNP